MHYAHDCDKFARLCQGWATEECQRVRAKEADEEKEKEEAEKEEEKEEGKHPNFVLSCVNCACMLRDPHFPCCETLIFLTFVFAMLLGEEDGAAAPEGGDAAPKEEAEPEPAAKRARPVSLAMLDKRNSQVLVGQNQLRSFADQIARDVLRDERGNRRTSQAWARPMRMMSPSGEMLVVPASEVQIV